MDSRIENLDDIVELLKVAVDSPDQRLSAIKQFQEFIWKTESGGLPQDINRGQLDILDDLALDLDYYEPNPDYRSEDNSFYGTEKLRSEIRQALLKLDQLRG